jgi:hypothetical protein
MFVAVTTDGGHCGTDAVIKFYNVGLLVVAGRDDADRFHQDVCIY